MTPSSAFTLVPCFVCEKQLKRVAETEWAQMQPSGGVICHSSGNYGSRELDGDTVAFLVCDECLMERKGSVLHRDVIAPNPLVTYSEWL